MERCSCSRLFAGLFIRGGTGNAAVRIVEHSSCRLLLAGLFLLGGTSNAAAQIIDTIVGNVRLADGLAARQTPLVVPRAVAGDPAGAFYYIADDGSGTVRRIDSATGIATIVAGGGKVVDDLVPVPGKNASLDSPVGLALAPNGNVYIVDNTHYRIRLLTPNGLITTVAGNGTSGFSGDGGPAIRAQLDLPTGIARDLSGNLYITDRSNGAIRKVDAITGVITTIAGGPNATCPSSSSDSCEGIPAKDAALSSPYAIAVDAAGNVFFTDIGYHVVLKIEVSTGLIRTVAGTRDKSGWSGDGGPATSALLNFPRGIAVAANGDLFIGHSQAVRKVSASTGIITAILGTGSSPLAEGPASAVLIPSSIGELFLSTANILSMAFSGDNVIGQVNLNTGIFTLLAGNPQAVGDGGPALRGAVAQPRKLALDGAGNLYIADTLHHRVRRVSPGTGGVGTGTITTVVGTGIPAFTESSGPASSAAISFPIGIAFASNNLYLTDNFSRIRRVGSDGILRTIAGTSQAGFSGDGGPATSAQLNGPEAMVVDSAGNVYIADTGNHRIRKIAPNGIISTIAGTGYAGFYGDGGPATSADLYFPTDLVLDNRGGLLIADYGNFGVRRLDFTTGTLTTLDPFFYLPTGLALDGGGNLYVGSLNQVDRVDAATGEITVVAGNGEPGSQGDGALATLARVTAIEGIAIDSSGNLILSDRINNRLRRVSSLLVVPALAVSPTTLSFNAVQGGASPAEQGVSISTSNLARASWTASVRVNSGSGWLRIRPTSGATPAAMQVAIDSAALAAGTYSGSITVSASGASNSPQTIAVNVTVTAAQGDPKLAVDRQFLTFTTSEGGSSPVPQTVSLTNTRGGTLQWSAAALTANGGDWLTVSPASGTGAASVTVSAALGSLKAGVYQGLIRLSNRTTGESEVISVAFIVERSATSLLLSQTGAVFTATEGSSFIRPESVSVINAGTGTMNWQARVTPLSGGDWLTVSPASGSNPTGAGATLNLSASLAGPSGGLRAGVYDALVTVAAGRSANSPQLVLARLHVLPASTPPVGRIRPGGMAFVGTSVSNIKPQTVTLSSSGGTQLDFVTSASTSDGASWLAVFPSAGSLRGSADSATLTVQAYPAGLDAGAYRGRITVSFGTGVTQDLGVLLVVTPSSTGVGTRREGGAGYQIPGAAACNPAQQFPFHTALVNNFSLPTGWPTPLVVRVLDNCGSPVDNSIVIATFSSGEDAQPLDPKGDGVYSYTWKPSRTGTTSITVTASGAGLQSGKAEPLKAFVSTLTGLGSLPLVNQNGVVSGASFQRFSPLAPGQIFSVFGSNLSPQQSSAAAIPLPRSLSGISAKLAGVDAPLYYTDGGQVNAQIPFELEPGGTYPLVVTGAGFASPPELITLTKTSPGIFTVNSSGAGPGVITDAQGKLVDSSNPARKGEVVIIWATGLGATNPAVPTGEASPSNPPAQIVDPVTISFGAVEAQPSFAGLTPGLVGLYQINVVVPSGAPTGDAVELFLQQNQISSNRVTLAIQ